MEMEVNCSTDDTVIMVSVFWVLDTILTRRKAGGESVEKVFVNFAVVIIFIC